jgi:4-amino-4-deoxy-L-arabinose transferase-like glycosyltransferase
MVPEFSTKVSSRLRLAAVAVLLGHFACLVHLSYTDFATYDEVGNIAAGLSYWETGQYHLYSVNPPLFKTVATLPVWLAGPDVGMLDVADVPGARPEHELGDKFARANAAQYRIYVFLARLFVIPWSLGTGFILYCWLKRLANPMAALIGLTLWCFEPNILTHGHLVTADSPSAFGAALAGYTLWRYFNETTWEKAICAGLALGLAQALKFTLVVLYPLWLVLSIWAIITVRHDPMKLRIVKVLAQLLSMYLISFLVIGITYEFEGVGRGIGELPFVSTTFKGKQGPSPGNRLAGSWVGMIPSPFPEHYIRGIDVQRHGFERYENDSIRNFLFDEWKSGGWWYYYLVAAAVKTPLGTSILALIGFVFLARRWRSFPPLTLPILLSVPLVVLVLVSANTSMNKHLRYVLPAYPFLIVAAASPFAFWASLSVYVRGSLLCLLLASVGSVLFQYPHMLTYFNEAVGGPIGGHRYLSGSNVDLGQDLWRLRQWLEAHPDQRPLGLVYHNCVDARIAGLEFYAPPALPPTATASLDETANRRVGPQPGRFAVGVRYLQGSGGRVPDGRGGFFPVPQGGYTYFKHFRPIAIVGNSFYIYDLTLEDVNRVRIDLGLRPLKIP